MSMCKLCVHIIMNKRIRSYDTKYMCRVTSYTKIALKRIAHTYLNLLLDDLEGSLLVALGQSLLGRLHLQIGVQHRGVSKCII